MFSRLGRAKLVGDSYDREHLPDVVDTHEASAVENRGGDGGGGSEKQFFGHGADSLIPRYHELPFAAG